MFTIYVYVLDTLADWEIGYVTSELNSGRFFKKDANRVSLKTVSYSKESIKTMGGMTIVPDCVIDDIVMSETSVLLLPGADTWNNLEHKAIIEKASELLALNATVAAICGATVALANHGLLDNRPHTSNGAGFLEMFSSSYKGQSSYINELSVGDNNLITASSLEPCYGLSKLLSIWTFLSQTHLSLGMPISILAIPKTFMLSWKVCQLTMKTN